MRSMDEQKEDVLLAKLRVKMMGETNKDVFEARQYLWDANVLIKKVLSGLSYEEQKKMEQWKKENVNPAASEFYGFATKYLGRKFDSKIVFHTESISVIIKNVKTAYLDWIGAIESELGEKI